MERSLAGAALHLSAASEALRGLKDLPPFVLRGVSTGSSFMLLGDCDHYEHEVRWLVAEFCEACRKASAESVATGVGPEQ